MLALRPGQAKADVDALFQGRINGAAVRGDWRQVERLSRDLLKLLPDSLPGHLSLAASLRSLGRRDAAAAVSRKAAALDWRAIPRLEDRFRCLMQLGSFAEAFAVAEALLDGGSFLHPHELFWNPWGNFPRELDALGKARSPWVRYYRDETAEFPTARYGWMNVKSALALASRGRYEESAARFEKALAYRPVQWRTRGYFGEVLLCVGRGGEARAQLSRAVAEAPAEQRGFALAWQGEIELWLGRYARARALLDEACSLGAQHAFCWRAAAVLKLGKRRQALRLFDETIARFPIDREAYVWRGEAKRELGLLREALADLDQAGGSLWSNWNSALVMARLGEEGRLLEIFARIPRDVVERLCRKLRRRWPESPREVVRVLEAGVRLSRGFRRDDYDQRVWLPDR